MAKTQKGRNTNNSWQRYKKEEIQTTHGKDTKREEIQTTQILIFLQCISY
jgi:hypothetical protein